MKHNLEQMAAEMAADFSGPVGPIPIERIVRKHLPHFEGLRSKGLTWEQIARLLAAAGMIREDGRAFSPSHLRGVFGRQRKRVLSGVAPNPDRDANCTQTTKSGRGPKEPQGSRGSKNTTSPVIASNNKDFGRRKPIANVALGGDGTLKHSRLIDDGQDAMVGPVEAQILGKASSLDVGDAADNAGSRDRARILALMRQSADARRNLT